MTLLRTSVLALMVAPFLALSVAAEDAAQGIPEPLGDTVSDFSSALDATEEGRISRIMAETSEKTGIELVVVTVESLDQLNGKDMRIEDVGRALFDAWGIGDKTKNDGILILIDTAAREARITLGTGYPPVYDERAARVLSTALLPKLREGRTAGAIEAAIISARDRLMIPFLAGEPVSATDGFEPDRSTLPLRIAIGVAGVLGFAGISIWRRMRSKRVCPSCGALTLKRENEIILAPTKFQEGLGLQHMTCTSCGFIDRHSYPIKYSDRKGRRSRDDRLTPTAGGVDETDPG